MLAIIIGYVVFCLIVGGAHYFAFLQDLDPYPSLVMGVIFTVGAPFVAIVNVACSIISLCKPDLAEASEMFIGASYGIMSLMLDNITPMP